MGTKDQEPDQEPYEPGGRKHQLIEKMSTEDLAGADGEPGAIEKAVAPRALKPAG